MVVSIYWLDRLTEPLICTWIPRLTFAVSMVFKAHEAGISNEWNFQLSDLSSAIYQFGWTFGTWTYCDDLPWVSFIFRQWMNISYNTKHVHLLQIVGFHKIRSSLLGIWKVLSTNLQQWSLVIIIYLLIGLENARESASLSMITMQGIQV